jgi:hypothetical protein
MATTSKIRPVLLTAVGLAATVALAAGCGASSTPSTAPPPTTTAGSAAAASSSTAPISPATTATTATTATSGGDSPAGASTTAAGPGRASTGSTTPTISVATPSIERCPTAALSISLGPPNSGMSHAYYPLIFRNSGTTPCTLTGYPGVSYVAGGDGVQVGAAATREATMPVATVTLAPGATATDTLDVIDPQAFDPATCRLTAVRGFRVYPPGDTAAAFISRSGEACAATSLPGYALSVTAVQAS